MTDSIQPLLINGDEPNKNGFGMRRGTARRITSGGFLRMRYVLIALFSFGSFNIYATRVTMSMALVCMVNHSAILVNSYSTSNQTKNNSVTSKCFQDEEIRLNVTNTGINYNEDGPFLWDEELQGILLSSFFWGYVFTQLPGGFLADKFGGKWIFGFSVLSSSLLTMAVPTAAAINPNLVIISRVLCGIAQGVFFPTMYSIASKWAPKQEKSRFMAFSGSGVPLGVIATYPISAALCKSQLFGGWPAIFYVIGSLGIVWFVLWCFLMYETPSEHPWINAEERYYIEQNTFYDLDRSKVSIPWCSILKSPPVLSLCVLEFCMAYKYFMMLTQLPTYLKVVLNFNIQENGYISVVPQILSAVIGLFACWMADVLINKGTFSISFVRKLLTLTGAVIACICLIGVTQLGCDRVWIVILLWVGLSIDSLNAGGGDVNAMDLSPNFTGVLKGILNSMAAAAGVASPYIVGILIKNNNTKLSWDTAFYVATGLYMFGALTYLVFGSGHVQSWNYTVKNSDDDDDYNEREDVVYEKSQLMKG